jgi:hypothetical protein
MVRLDAIKRIVKRSLNLNNLLNLSNLTSMVFSEKKRVIKNSGRKLTKYLEVTK